MRFLYYGCDLFAPVALLAARRALSTRPRGGADPSLGLTPGLYLLWHTGL